MTLRGILLLGSLWLACGGDDGPAADGGPLADGAAPGDAGSPDAAGPRRVADNVVFLERGARTLIRFSDDPEGPGSCLSEPVAGCEIQTCRPAVAIVQRPDAGLVTVTASSGQSYLPDDTGVYPMVPPVGWDDGEAVTVEAAGGEAPAFEVPLTGPGDVDTVIAPIFPATFRRDQAVAVEWTGADAFVTIAIRCPEPDAEGESVQVRCPFAGGTSGEVPVAAVSRLPVCGNASVYVYTEDRKVIDPAPDWAIRVATRGAIRSGTAVVE